MTRIGTNLSPADHALITDWTSLRPCGLKASIVPNCGMFEMRITAVIAIYRYSPAQPLWLITLGHDEIVLLTRIQEASTTLVKTLEAALGKIVHAETKKPFITH